MKTIKASFSVVLAFAAIVSAPFCEAQARILGMSPDSEYLIFVIDTSGSMRRYEWDRVVSTFEDALAMYPTVKGIQVLNDQGDHLLISYRGEWIPNTASNREWITRELRIWETYSTSNPRRGLLSVFDRYYDPGKSIALFLLSDDYSVGADEVDSLVAEVDARNSERSEGVPRVRIHTVAFPVFYDVLGRDQFANSTGADLAQLMPTLSQKNDGGFLGLSSKHAAVADSEANPAEGVPAAGAERILIIIDASANMREPYWRQAVDTVDWLFNEAGEGASFQVMALTVPPRSIVAGTEGQWLSNTDGSLRERVVTSLRSMTPAGAMDLGAATTVVRGLGPAPDKVYVLAAVDPRVGRQNYPRVDLRNAGEPPVDVLLFGAGDNPQAVPFYWSLALEGGGSLVAPAVDWP